MGRIIYLNMDRITAIGGPDSSFFKGHLFVGEESLSLGSEPSYEIPDGVICRAGNKTMFSFLGIIPNDEFRDIVKKSKKFFGSFFKNNSGEYLFREDTPFKNLEDNCFTLEDRLVGYVTDNQSNVKYKIWVSPKIFGIY